MIEIKVSPGAYLAALEYNAHAWLIREQSDPGITLAAFYAWIAGKV